MRNLKPIRSEKDHEQALAEVEELWAPRAARLGAIVWTSWRFRLKRARRSITPWTPRPDRGNQVPYGTAGPDRKDLKKILGTRMRGSEVLNRKRRRRPNEVQGGLAGPGEFNGAGKPT